MTEMYKVNNLFYYFIKYQGIINSTLIYILLIKIKYSYYYLPI